MRNRLIGSGLVAVIAVGIAAALLSRSAPETAATAAEGASAAPDLSGVWMPGQLTDTFSADPPPMTAWAEQRMKANVAGGHAEDPEDKCFPPGVSRLYLHRYPIEILQLPGRTLMHYEYDHFVRQIWTDGRTHPAADELDATWLGHSIGRWEGDTLIVDTVGFNDKTWIDNAGHPHSEALHLVERFRRADKDTLQIDFTFEDPKAYTKPWGGQKIFSLRPGWEISEHVCADNFLWKEPGK